jgi:hypothetical protein
MNIFNFNLSDTGSAIFFFSIAGVGFGIIISLVRFFVLNLLEWKRG